jgi:hypothetical protein
MPSQGDTTRVHRPGNRSEGRRFMTGSGTSLVRGADAPMGWQVSCDVPSSAAPSRAPCTVSVREAESMRFLDALSWITKRPVADGGPAIHKRGSVGGSESLCREARPGVEGAVA